MMRDDISTSITMTRDLCEEDYLISDAEARFDLEIDFTREEFSDPKSIARIRIFRHGLNEKKENEYEIREGDIFRLTHKFEFESVLKIDENHLFPVRFIYKNQTYLLNKTKQDKLILTK